MSNNTMATLDRWREFAAVPKTLIFSRLELLGYDHAPPIIVGSGEVRMDSTDSFKFMLSGIPSDIPYTLREINRLRANPYDSNARFRLVGLDEKKVRWSGGWTTPRLTMEDDVWIFAGEIENLSTDDLTDAVSRQAGAELLFSLRAGDPMIPFLARYIWTDRSGERPLREHELEILGSKIRFSYEPLIGIVSIVATQSSDFGAPFAENWLSEPLRVLFGQLIYPRLVARNFGDGHAWVSIRRTPSLVRGAGWVALWGKDEAARDENTFWSLYGQILKFVAVDRDQTGQPNFEASLLTRLYEECIQAARGSRWVWALTFASSIEGLIKMLQRKDAKLAELAKASSEETEAIESLVKHVNNWSGDANLKKVAANAVRRSGDMSAARILRSLIGPGTISSEQFSAWDAIRNRVMHGNLVSIYSTKEEDAKLLALAFLMHALTRELIHRNSADAYSASSSATVTPSG
jgi:hypothetical protein